MTDSRKNERSVKNAWGRETRTPSMVPGNWYWLTVSPTAAANPRVTTARLTPRSRRAGSPTSRPTRPAAIAPAIIQRMALPGAFSRLSSEVTQAPITAKESWQSAIIPALPVTTPRPSSEIAATITLVPRKT